MKCPALGLTVLRGAVLALCAALLSIPVHADEIDDLLTLKSRNQERLKRFSAEFTVETTPPKSLKDAKPTRLRYRLDVRRVPGGKAADRSIPFDTEIEIMEPTRSRMRMEGDRVSFEQPDGSWRAIDLTAEQRGQVSQMVAPYVGSTPADQRRNFSFRIVGRHSPLFGPRTITLESVPKGSAKLFSRLEEEIAGDGLPRVTRIYGANGAEVARLNVTKHRMINGVPVMESMEATMATPSGRMIMKTQCSGLVVEIQ